ncbi:MAG: hypothetical protein JWQ44_2955 [Chthoniobacter sp.]|nr:hypothetical protein [Chthoniobacter sp.]
MTITNKEARAQYEAHNERSRPTVYAEATNAAFEAVRVVAEQYGLKVNNTDAAENLVTQIFTFLWDSNHREEL